MGRKRSVSKKPVQKAESRFRKRMKQYEQYQFQPLDLSKYKQENILEDMPGMEAYIESADYATEQFQQSQANIMQAYKGAAGASGVAGIAQAMSGQATEFARGQQMSLGQRAAEARRLALQEKSRLQGQERQLMLQQDVTRRDFDYGKMTTMLGVEGEQVAGARQMYASEQQAAAQQSAGQMQMVGSLAMAAATLSDRRLKKNIKKEGKSPKGLQLYSFEYKDPSDGKGRWQGVIADDLPTSVKNKAVHKSADGYDMVNYSKLDVTLKQV